MEAKARLEALAKPPNAPRRRRSAAKKPKPHVSRSRHTARSFTLGRGNPRRFTSHRRSGCDCQSVNQIARCLKIRDGLQPRIEVKHVAHSVGQGVNVIEGGALLTGYLVYGQRHVNQHARDDQRNHTEHGVLRNGQRYSRFGRACRKREAAPIRLVHQRRQVLSRDSSG